MIKSKGTPWNADFGLIAIETQTIGATTKLTFEPAEGDKQGISEITMMVSASAVRELGLAVGYLYSIRINEVGGAS